MPNEENTLPSNVMDIIRERLIAMGYFVRSSISNSRLLFATNDTKGEAHSILLEGGSVRIVDINGRHESQRREIEREVKQCLNR